MEDPKLRDQQNDHKDKRDWTSTNLNRPKLLLSWSLMCYKMYK